MPRVALGLGANLGDRAAALRRAVEIIESDPAVDVVSVSTIIETDPVGGPEQPDYLNAVMVIETTLPPDAVLALAHRAEQDAGRVREVRWGPRTLDVDVLAYDDVESDDPVLTLPHPRALEREFVLAPWAEVDPEFVVKGRSVADWLSRLAT